MVGIVNNDFYWIFICLFTAFYYGLNHYYLIDCGVTQLKHLLNPLYKNRLIIEHELKGTAKYE